MKVIVNGVEKDFKKGATLKDAVEGEPYSPKSLISVHKSTESLKTESEDFEIVTTKGTMCIHLEKSEIADLWKSKTQNIEGTTARWVTHNIAAFGSFPTDLEVDRQECLYRRYDCFLSLGGFDNKTTYMMIARDDHKGTYGVGKGLIGRITRGRHIIDILDEDDSILEVRPAMSETITENFVVTSDLKYKLEEGNTVDTCVKIKIDTNCPESAEHLMIVTQKGYINVYEDSGSYMACNDDIDVKIKAEVSSVRAENSVFVRNTGVGTGRIFFYKERRQMVPSHNHIGDVVSGRSIISSAKEGETVTVVTDPARIMTVGMTMAKGEDLLRNAGVHVDREGLTDDDAIIVEQTPERTVDIINQKKVVLKGVSKEDIYQIKLDRSKVADVHYFEKITGLNHKPIGSLTVYFWFPGMSMVTFEGDEVRGKSLYPGEPFKKCKRGDIGLTNQACDHHGVLGIRMEDSKEFGPTGEEPFGTNIFGKFTGDLKRFENNLDDGKVMYITELEL